MSAGDENDIEFRDNDDAALRRHKIVMQKHRSFRTFGIIASIASVIAFGFAVFVFLRQLQHEKTEERRIEAYLKASDRFAQVLAEKELVLHHAQALVEQQSKDVAATRSEIQQMHADVRELQGQISNLQQTAYGSGGGGNGGGNIIPNSLYRF